MKKILSFLLILFLSISTNAEARRQGSTTGIGTWDLSGATLEIPNSASLPGTCSVGEIYMDTDATSGQRLYACESANTWVLQGDGGGGGGDHDAVTLAGQDYLSLATQQITANLIKGSNINWTLVNQIADTNINWTDFDVPSASINWDAFPNNQGYLSSVNWTEMPVVQSSGINWTGIDEDVITGINWASYVGGTGSSITAGNSELAVIDTGVGYGEFKENNIQVTKFHGINIEEIGSLTSSTYLDNVNRIFYSRGYIYAASYATNNTITVVDVMDPTAPKVVGSVATGHADGIWVAGKYAYVVECVTSDRIRIFDISDPSTPTLMSTLTDAQTGGAILDSPVEGMVVGNIFYLVSLHDDSLIAIDVSDPTAPFVLDYIKDSTNFEEAHGVYADGRFVYVASAASNSLCVVDAQNPSDLTLRSCISDATKLGGAGDLEVKGGYAYVTAETTGYLTIVDVSDPDTLSIAGQITNEYLGGIDGIHLLGTWAIVSSTVADYLSIIDISDPTTPTMVSYLASVDGDGVFCSGNICYVANEAASTIKVYRVGGIEAPSITTGDILADFIHTTQSVDVGHNLYVGGGLSVGSNALFQGPASFTNLKLPNSATLPAACSIGQIYMDTDATSGQRLYACESANTWVLQGDGTSALGANSVQSSNINWPSVQDMIGDTQINWTSVRGITGTNINWMLIDETVITAVNWASYESGADVNWASVDEDVLVGINWSDYENSGDLYITAAPASDHVASGLKTTFTANENQAFGDVVYINADGEAQLADADAIATGKVVAMATASISANASGTYLLQGIARDDTWNWTVGGYVYLSTTGTSGNTLTQTAPSGEDDCVVIIGIATHADRIYFNPSMMIVEVAA